MNVLPSDAPAGEAGVSERPSVSFELTPEDWVEVSVRHHASSSQVRKAERTSVGLFIVIMVLTALLALLYGSSSLALTLLLIGGVVTALMPSLIRSTRKKQFGQFARAGITNGLFGTHRVELREDGILNVTDGYEWLVRWSAVERVEDGEGAFLVYNGPNSFMVVPHSAFRDSASLRRFADVFYERLGAARAAAESDELLGPSRSAAELPGSSRSAAEPATASHAPPAAGAEPGPDA